MAKPKLTNFAQVLRLLGTLTDGEKATLRDVLRPEPTKQATKKASTKGRTETPPPLFTETPKDASEEVRQEICAACGNGPDYADHFKPSPVYHPFESPSRAKSAGKRSSRGSASTKGNGSGQATSEMLPDVVGNAAHAASGGD